MNYSSFIVKILSEPERSSFEKDISVTEFVGKFFQYRDSNASICKISIWGNLVSNLDKYYNVNDYLIVEGYLSFRKSNFEEFDINTDIELTVFKIYPFSLKSLEDLAKFKKELF